MFRFTKMKKKMKKTKKKNALFDPVIGIRRPTLRLDKKSLSCGPPVHYNLKNMKIIKLSLNTNYIQ